MKKPHQLRKVTIVGSKQGSLQLTRSKTNSQHRYKKNNLFLKRKYNTSKTTIVK
jgi:hypothetical protein